MAKSLWVLNWFSLVSTESHLLGKKLHQRLTELWIE